MTTSTVRSQVLATYFEQRGLRLPAGIEAIFESDLPRRLRGSLCQPSHDVRDGVTPGMAWAEAIIDASDWPLLPNLLPLLALDERSFACVVASDLDEAPLPGEGAVVRWHLEVASEEHQASLLDTDCFLYLQSVAEENEARQLGIDRMMNEIGPAYELNYLQAEKRPRDFVVRPVRIVCQNVVVGLAAFAHDSSIDAMSVLAWQTCEVPHVATHEGNRALAALMLCDAFQSGGTMEIRFDRPARVHAQGATAKSGELVDVNVQYNGHPERQVPASLRRYGRTVGVALGAEDRGAVSPAEARQLFMAVTPMPAGLAERVRVAVDAGMATPERLCFTLLSQVWREIELDFMLAVSARTGSIIRGGAPWKQRAARQAESDVARAALMVGMLHRRLDTRDGAGATGVAARVLEDNRVGVSWHVLNDAGAIVYLGTPGENVPWQSDTPEAERRALAAGGSLVVLPRPCLAAEDIKTATKLRAVADVVAVAIPHDGVGDRAHAEAAGVLLLRCPDRLGELDQVIEAKLLKGRIAPA